MTIKELLDKTPEELATIPTSQLEAILQPYFPAVRKALLPPEKSRKSTVETSMIQQLLEANKDAIAAMRKGRTQ